jgi:hypothetical protein
LNAALFLSPVCHGVPVQQQDNYLGSGLGGVCFCFEAVRALECSVLLHIAAQQ